MVTFAIFLILFVGIPIGIYSDMHREKDYNLISCNHISNCEQAGKFQTLDSCLDMKKQLESKSDMNSYVCETAVK